MTPLATLLDRRRSAERQEVELDATVRLDGRPLDAIIFNLSASGCLFFCSDRLEVGETMTIGIAGIGRQPIRIVRIAHLRYGAEFEKPLTPSHLSLAASMLGNMVVALPKQPDGPSNSEDESPLDKKLPLATRLLITGGIGIAGWTAVALVIRAIQ